MNQNANSYKSAVEQLACTLVITPEGKLVEANNLFLMHSGATDLSSTMISDFTHGQYDQDYYERILKHVQQGFTWRDEVKMQYKENEPFWLDINIAPLADGSGNILLIGFDITERKTNEEIIKMQQQQLFTQSQFSALGEMASGIAHEINNPLAIIATSTAVIKQMMKFDSLDPEMLSRITSDVDSTVKRISKIIQGLRNISRDPNKDEFEITNISDILDDVLSLCEEKFRGHGVNFTVSNLEDFKDIPIEVLKVQLSQVILNLLNNAYDAIGEREHPDHDPWIDLKINYDQETELMTLTVTDCGPGISNSIAEKIFNPFFTTKDIGKGTGLGLSLSNAILKRHKGKLYINHQHENTQFVLEFPRTQQKVGSNSENKGIQEVQ